LSLGAENNFTALGTYARQIPCDASTRCRSTLRLRSHRGERRGKSPHAGALKSVAHKKASCIFFSRASEFPGRHQKKVGGTLICGWERTWLA
jgi:hypothetical protein